MRQMNELFNKHERVWFSLLGEESQRQFLQAIHEYDPASTVAPDQIGRHMAMCRGWYGHRLLVRMGSQ